MRELIAVERSPLDGSDVSTVLLIHGDILIKTTAAAVNKSLELNLIQRVPQSHECDKTRLDPKRTHRPPTDTTETNVTRHRGTVNGTGQ